MKLFKEENTGDIRIGADNESTPIGYSDATNIIEVGGDDALLNMLEYNSIRKWVGQLFTIKGFQNCNPTELAICSKWILLPYTIRLMFFLDNEDKINWDELVVRTEGNPIGHLQGRAKIYQKLRICVSDYVRREVWELDNYYSNLTMSQQLFRDVKDMKDFFIGANDPEFGEFLRSNGRYNDITGFKGKNYYLANLETDLINIYNEY